MQSENKGNLVVRRFNSKDERAVIEICCETGYMGESLSEGFKDRDLFAMIFALHYPDFEPDMCFVAEVKGAVVGYCFGTTVTCRQRQHFSRYYKRRIASRVFTRTLWNHPSDVYQVMKWNQAPPRERDYVEEFPAHFHMNVHPGYQKQGAGQVLIDAFFSACREKGVTGLHLETTSGNLMALNSTRRTGSVSLEPLMVRFGGRPGSHPWYLRRICSNRKSGQSVPGIFTKVATMHRVIWVNSR